MIHVEQLSYRYPGSSRPAIDGLSLDVAAGSLFGLLGPNGSGKTTLACLLTGLLRPRSGSIRIGNGGAVTISLVPQEYAFYDRLSVIENLRFFAGVQGVRDAARIGQVIETASLDDYRDVRAARLSGGLKRRLNLAIGLLREPQLLLLDEPTVGIDPQSRHFILEAIRRINADGTTVVYSSHYMEEVQALCDEIGILDRGRLLARGDLGSLLDGGQDGELAIGLEHVPTAAQQARLQSIEGLAIDQAELRIAHCPAQRLPRLFADLADIGVGVSRLRYGHADLESLFLHLTGHQLRD